MKKIIFLLLLISASAFGQKTIVNPGVRVDTTFANTHFIFSWDGNTKFFVTDSIVSYSDLQPVYNHNYLDTDQSYARLEFKMQRIPVIGDTLVRYKNIDLPFIEIEKAINNYLGTAQLNKYIKKALKKEYIKKLSQE